MIGPYGVVLCYYEKRFSFSLKIFPFLATSTFFRVRCRVLVAYYYYYYFTNLRLIEKSKTTTRIFVKGGVLCVTVRIVEGACRVMITVIGNGHDDPSSNPKLD